MAKAPCHCVETAEKLAVVLTTIWPRLMTIEQLLVEAGLWTTERLDSAKAALEARAAVDALFEENAQVAQALRELGQTIRASRTPPPVE